MAIPPLLASALISGGSSLIESLLGISQGNKADKIMGDLKGQRMSFLQNNQFDNPDFKTPEAVYKAINLAKGNYMDTTLPGAAVAKNDIAGNQSQLASLLTNSGANPNEFIAGIVGANANANKGYNDLATAGANRQQQDLNTLLSTLNTEGQYKEKEYNYNELLPYTTNYNNKLGMFNKEIDQQFQNAMGLKQAGQTNAFSGLEGIFGAGANYFSGLGKKNDTKDFLDQLTKLLGGGGSGSRDATNMLNFNERLS